MTYPNNAQPPRYGVIKRTIGGSLARRWPPPLPRRRRCCVLLLLLLGLSAAAANNRCAVLASSVSVLAYVWSFLAWARGTACVVRYTTLSAATAAAAAAAASECFYVLPPPPPPLLLLLSVVMDFIGCTHSRCFSCFIKKTRSPGGGKWSLQNKMGQPEECFLLDL